MPIAEAPPPRKLPPVPTPTFSPPPPLAPVASTSRPTIKLKVGSQVKADTVPKVTQKPRARKPRDPEGSSTEEPIVDAPPPPYVDDGSHDLLQEVLAIERQEKTRHRSVSDKDKVVVNGSSGKRKMVDLVSDDDLLILATPSKKERPSSAETSASSSTIPKLAIPPPAPKAGPSKPKKEKNAVPSISLHVDKPRTSAKGKEREIISEPVASKAKRPSSAQATPINEKKCKDLLKVLQRLPEAAIFLRPVDPVADGCPTCVICYSLLLSVSLTSDVGISTRLSIRWISARSATSCLGVYTPRQRTSERISNSFSAIVDNSIQRVLILA